MAVERDGQFRPNSPTVTVTIDGGSIAGSVSPDGQTMIFQGVPYAAPPVSELRWRPPAPVAPWGGTRPALAFGPSSIQPALPTDRFYADIIPAPAEDSLYLNVWAPVDGERLPVIVWIHGGGLLVGTGSSALTDGAKLAAEGAVVVAINYRLGVMGFLAHPELVAESPQGAAGNYGTLDQIAALRWVQANIAGFGGDPANVTIMGQSAGALSVAYLMASPMAAGLFRRAIAQSPVLASMPTIGQAANGLDAAERAGERLAERAGVSGIDALRAVPAEQLLSLAMAPDILPYVTAGTVDGWVHHEQVYAAFAAGRAAAVPLITGYTRDEMLGFERDSLPPVPDGSDAYTATITAAYADLASAFLTAYPADDPVGGAAAAARDALYGWAAAFLATAHSRGGHTTYMYAFDHAYRGARERGVGAFHGIEIPYVFGAVGIDPPTMPNWPAPPSDDIDLAISRTLMALWVAFARTGRPAAASIDWPGYDPDAPQRLRIDNGLQIERGGRDVLLSLHDDIIGRRAASGKGWGLAQLGIWAPAGFLD